jgi:hypothetical protein
VLDFTLDLLVPFVNLSFELLFESFDFIVNLLDSADVLFLDATNDIDDISVGLALAVALLHFHQATAFVGFAKERLVQLCYVQVLVKNDVQVILLLMNILDKLGLSLVLGRKLGVPLHFYAVLLLIILLVLQLLDAVREELPHGADDNILEAAVDFVAFIEAQILDIYMAGVLDV